MEELEMNYEEIEFDEEVYRKVLEENDFEGHEENGIGEDNENSEN